MDSQLVVGLSCGVIMQVAYVLLADRQRRQELQVAAPATVVLLVVYSAAAAAVAVSYTHLTLPTILLV